MKKSLLQRALAGTLLAASSALAFAQPSGQWDFNSGNLNATVGAPLTYISGPAGPAQQATTFNSTTGFSIPNIGGEVAQVMKTGAYANSDGLYMPNPAAGNGGGSYVNDYTLIMDILVPAESNSKARALLDADQGAINADAEFFINADNGLGAKGVSFGRIATNTWHRIAYVVDVNDDPAVFSGTIRVYIDGAEVGTRNIGNLKDDRFALSPSGTSSLFSDDANETATLYVNSIQLRPEALNKGQIRALAGATAAGIPQVLPPVPSGIERWIPVSEFASRNTTAGAIITTGSTTIQDSSISVRLNGAQQTTTIQRNGELITVATAPLALTPGVKYTNVVSYTDSLAGARSFTNVFTAALFAEDFESIVLGPGLEEAHAADIGWANQPPTGWTIDNTQMAGFASEDLDGDGRKDGDGRSEWFGWAFANKDWWVRADDQRRSEFGLASGTVAIADPDEWDDGPHDVGLFNSFLKTPPISLAGVGANTAFLRFVSSWRPEGLDDSNASRFTVGPNGEAVNNQTAIVSASFDGGAPVQLLKWDSRDGSPTFHPDSVNESVLLPLNNPAGAQNVVLTFAMVEGANDWWWAVDNITLTAGASMPTITTHPRGGHYSVGGKLSMTVAASGTEPFTYQWKRNGQNIAGATSQTLNIDYLEANAAGDYTVAVSNAAGTVESNAAKVFLSSAAITDGLVAHLKFDDTLQDSAKSNHGAAVGSPGYIAGKAGKAVQITSGANYVTLGAPADLNFGTSTDFSVSFWAQVNGLSGDPAFISNKDWDSGSNQGYVIFSAGNRRIAWNLAGAPGGRKDSGATPGIFPDNTWAHIVMTFDRDGTAVTYVNGVATNITDLSASQNNVDTPANFNTNLGQDGAGDYGSSFSDLRMDDLGIWRRVLTVQEVQSILAAGNAGRDLSTASFEPPAARVTGQWDFDNGDLSATVGQPLAYRGDTQGGTTFSTMTIDGQPAKVMGFPAATREQGYIMTHGASPNGGGAFVNVYTLIMDIMFPATSTGWRGLFQTSESNANDGDLFVNPGNGIGISGNYPGQVLPDTWHRVAFVIDLPKGTLAKYIDGSHVGTQSISGIDGRFSLGATALLFTDEDGETAAGFVNSFQFRDGAMRASEIQELGGAKASGIPGGTSPTPQIRAGISASGGNVVISVNAAGSFQLQRKARLTDATWSNVGSPAAGPFTVPADQASGFFRVVQQ